MTRKQLQKLERLIDKKVAAHVALAQLKYDSEPRELERAINARESADFSLVNYLEDLVVD